MDGQYDVAWSEMNDNQLVSTCGDGSVKLWDLQSPGFPLMSWEEHQAEVAALQQELTALREEHAKAVTAALRTSRSCGHV